VIIETQAEPPTAEETESAGLAVEIRMLWGTDPLWIRHLSPPRTFDVPGVVSGDAAPPLVVVEASGPSVLVPEGASVTIEGKASGAPAARRVALSLGDRVSIALPSPGAASEYRSAPAAEGAARIVFEVALVRAGRDVGRGRPLAGRGRLLAAVAVVGALASGYLALMRSLTPEGFDDDEPAREQGFLMYQYLHAAAEKERREMPPLDVPEELPTRPLVELRGTPLRYWQAPDEAFEQEPFDVLARIEVTPFGPWFARFIGGDGALYANGFPRASAALYAGGPLTPLGIQGISPAPWPDATQDRGPSVLWFEQIAAVRSFRALGSSTPAAHPAVVSATERVDAPLPETGVDRAVRRRLRYVRSCYELGLHNNPNLVGTIDLVFWAGVDGAAQNPSLLSASMPDPGVVSCTLRALDGMRSSPPLSWARRFTYRLRFGPGE
jgi:hypothetical protein